MKYLYIKKNNNYISVNEIEQSIRSIKQVKKKNNIIINSNYIKHNIRKGSSINLSVLGYTNDINIFSYSGIIKKKNKKNNINNSTTIKALISGKYVELNIHLFSDNIRFE
jgi:hypothetical protein